MISQRKRVQYGEALHCGVLAVLSVFIMSIPSVALLIGLSSSGVDGEVCSV